MAARAFDRITIEPVQVGRATIWRWWTFRDVQPEASAGKVGAGANAFHNSPEYQAAASFRRQGAGAIELVIVAGGDATPT